MTGSIAAIIIIIIGICSGAVIAVTLPALFKEALR